MIIAVALATCLTCSALGQTAPQSDPGKDRIRSFVSILPQAYFVEEVGGGLVQVDVLVGPGQSPHTFEPTPKQAAKLTEAQIYFRIGLPFEDRLAKKIEAARKALGKSPTEEAKKAITDGEAELKTLEDEAKKADRRWMDLRMKWHGKQGAARDLLTRRRKALDG